MTNQNSGNNPIRVLLIDDHALFRQGINAVLSRDSNIKVVGEAEDGIEGLVKAEALQPDIVLLDINMPNCDGLTAVRRITSALPETKVIMLTAIRDDEAIIQALRDGASGYLLKDIEPEKMCETLRAISHGESALSDSVVKQLINQVTGNSGPKTAQNFVPQEYKTLTRQERKVLSLIAQGCSNKDIASALFVAENTVKIHLRNILKKLNLDNRIQAAVFAVTNNLDQIEEDS